MLVLAIQAETPQSLERVNREIGRRYLAETSPVLVIATNHPDLSATTGNQEVAQLTAS
jgi:hypothetical protein